MYYMLEQGFMIGFYNSFPCYLASYNNAFLGLEYKYIVRAQILCVPLHINNDERKKNSFELQLESSLSILFAKNVTFWSLGTMVDNSTLIFYTGTIIYKIPDIGYFLLLVYNI
ncbi:MAG: hypothetical protein EXX96DRAFT_612503 [Benjaminiella poitrasii]|nr:MAG: hypothetical protein EXX96DRAFT_612503 [Benjaminiella poitrasii]